jgi:hypothetical protein
MAASASLVLWLGRDTTVSVDELSFFVRSPELDLGSAFDPHNGHLMVGPRLIYKAGFEALGSDYLTFRVLTVVAVLSLAAVMFAFMRRRVGAWVALAPTVILLFYGTGASDLLRGIGFAGLTPLAAGVGSLLAVDRRDTKGDIAACALLCLGITFHTVALPFVAGVGVFVWLQGRRQRLWIVGIPAVLYAAWLLWSLGASDVDAADQVSAENVLLAPTWAFQSLTAVLGGVTGLDYDFGDPGLDPRAGPVLALAAIAALVWRMRDPSRVPAALWTSLAIVATLWTLFALASGPGRVPDATRYMYPATVACLIVAGVGAADLRWRRAAIAGIYAVAAIGLATNIILLRDAGDNLRDGHAVDVRSALAGIEVAGDSADPTFDPNDDPDPVSPLRQSVVRYVLGGDEPTGRYLEAADGYGELGYSIDEVRALEDADRIRTDAFLAGALDLALRSMPSTSERGCEVIEAEPGGPITATLPPGGAVLSAKAASGPIHLRRFADTPSVQVGTLTAGRTAELAIPTDEVPDPWVASMPGAALTICPLS